MILILLVSAVNAAKITVGPEGANYTHIQQAINNASFGDVIEVHSGTYYENIYAYKNITLKGLDTGKGNPVIIAGGSGSVITLTADGITVEGFNLTNSGHCGCGNAGVLVESNNNIVFNNIIYKNKYGIYVRQGKGNKFFLNDLVDNNISAYDSVGSRWDGDVRAEGIQGIIELLFGKRIKGNHYSDYDEPKEGCNDTNRDGICDSPRKIEGESSGDYHPLIFPIHP